MTQTGSKYMEPSREQTAQLILLGAKRDLEIAWHNFEGAYFEATCFYAFLAAEKSIKSLLFLSGSYPPDRPIKQHDLVLLFREARGQYSELSSIENEIAVFRIYDEHTRYLDEAEGTSPWESYTEADAAEAMPAAQRIYESAHKIVNATEAIISHE